MVCNITVFGMLLYKENPKPFNNIVLGLLLYKATQKLFNNSVLGMLLYKATQKPFNNTVLGMLFAGSEDLLKIEEQEELDSSLPVPVRQHIGMRKEHVNYRGYSNVQQFALFSSLLNQSTIGRYV